MSALNWLSTTLGYRHLPLHDAQLSQCLFFTLFVQISITICTMLSKCTAGSYHGPHLLAFIFTFVLHLICIPRVSTVWCIFPSLLGRLKILVCLWSLIILFGRTKPSIKCGYSKIRYILIIGKGPSKSDDCTCSVIFLLLLHLPKIRFVKHTYLLAFSFLDLLLVVWSC